MTTVFFFTVLDSQPHMEFQKTFDLLFKIIIINKQLWVATDFKSLPN